MEYEEYCGSCEGKDVERGGSDILERIIYKLASKDCVKPQYNSDTLPSLLLTYKAHLWLVLWSIPVWISTETPSILNWDYCSFHQSPRHITGITWIKSRPLPSTSSSVYYSLIILQFGVINVHLRMVMLRGVHIQFTHIFLINLKLNSHDILYTCGYGFLVFA